jgi:hypothetical protein
MLNEIFIENKKHPLISNQHHLCARLFSYTNEVISDLNKQKMLSFTLDKCYNYKKQAGKINIDEYNINTLFFTEIRQTNDCPFLIEIYCSQIFLKTCRIKDFINAINKNTENKYIFFPIKYHNYDKKHRQSNHITLLVLDNKTKECFYIDPNGWSDKNYEKIIEDTFEKFCQKINYTYIYSYIWNKNNININFGNENEIGHCVPLCYLAIIFMNNNRSLFDYFNDFSNNTEEYKRELIKKFENYLIHKFFDKDYLIDYNLNYSNVCSEKEKRKNKAMDKSKKKKKETSRCLKKKKKETSRCSKKKKKETSRCYGFY